MMGNLTLEQIQKAIAYNSRRGFSADQMAVINAAVGGSPQWDTTLVTLIASWQRRKGLAVDGMVGPATWSEMHLDAEHAGATMRRNSVEICCGLAAYDQAFPGHTPAEAMQAAFDAAMAEKCKEVRYWSTEHLIGDLGNKGNSYAEPFLRGLQVPPGVKIGAWGDDPWSVMKTPEWAKRLRDMNVTVVSLMTNRSNTRATDLPWDFNVRIKDLLAVSENLHNHRIERALTAWPRPSRTQIDEMCETVGRLASLIQASRFEVDAEGNWRKLFLDGFPDMVAASRYLVGSMRSAVPGGRISMTTFTDHVENSPKAILAPLMDDLFPQCYAVRQRREKIEWNDLLGPVRHVGYGVRKARLAAAA